MDSFKSLQDSISAALVSTTRSATQLGAADIPFQRSLNPEIGPLIDSQNARLLQLAQRLLQNAAASSDAVGPKLPDTEAIDGNWKGVVDVIDSLLEKADTSLDEFTGVVKRLSPGRDQGTTGLTSRFPAAPKQLPKPQLFFEHVPKNDETGGFRPLMTYKPHAQVPLEECLKTFKDSNGREQYPHPYQTEIETYQYPRSMYKRAEPQPYPPFEQTTATFVDTPEALATMLAELKTAKEIAIDLEHHDNRSYIGIVSLMQISTRNKDWIVDTLVPWRRRLECLNEVFADPQILKVLHGSYMDIVWLQRDLGLYIVGLFDTYHAARSLGYPGASLAFLLDKFVNFKAQKQYQMADWRVRPLSDELFKYARADTHFLLYIYDHMRNELIDRSNFLDPESDKILRVLTKSRETALQRFEHPIYDKENGLGPVSWYRPISRTPVQYTRQQFAIFRAVHKWRDDVAREEDESPAYIMPNHAVFSIVRTPPETKASLFGVLQHVSPVLRLRADQLIAVIAKAMAEGQNGPDLNETIKRISDLKFVEDAPNVVKVTEAATQATPTIQPAPTVATLDTLPPRAATSTFWGPLWSNGAAYQRRLVSTLNINLALPLPPLTAEIFTDNTGSSALESTPAEKPEHTFVPKEDRPPEDERTDIFIVKQLGGKRKRGVTNEESETRGKETAGDVGADEIMLDDDGHDDLDEEAARKRDKKLRKAARKLKKAQQSSGNAGQPLNNDEAAFDYAHAPSVLHARDADKNQSRGGKKKRDKKKKDQGFNPYSGMTDAPKGLPRAQKESAGRSKTFSS